MKELSIKVGSSSLIAFAEVPDPHYQGRDGQGDRVGDSGIGGGLHQRRVETPEAEATPTKSSRISFSVGGPDTTVSGSPSSLKKMATAQPQPGRLIRTATTISAVDSDILEKQELTAGLEEGYIAQVDKDGNIKNVPVRYKDQAVTPVEDDRHNSMSDFVSADILTKPFNFVSGNVSKARFNPFRKKSGLLNVLAKQSTRNRIVAKNGSLNTESHAGTKSHHFFKDFFTSVLDMGWSWIFFFFSAGFFFSWLVFAVVWYLTFLQHGDLNPDNLANETFVPCVAGIEGFTSCFLFSVETQHTIGYGGR